MFWPYRLSSFRGGLYEPPLADYIGSCRNVSRATAYLLGLGLASGNANVDNGEGGGAVGEAEGELNSGAIDGVGAALGLGLTVGLGVGVDKGGMMFSQWCSGTVAPPISSTSA